MMPKRSAKIQVQALITCRPVLLKNDEISEKFAHPPLEHLPRGLFFGTIEDGIEDAADEWK